MTDAVKELVGMLSIAANEEGATIFDHTPEEIGLHVMENHTAILAALEQAGEPVAADPARDRVIMASARLGKWMSAALDDPKVCDEMKADIREWFSAGEPVAGWLPTLQRLGQEFDTGEGLAALLTEAIGDITVALTWAGKSGKIAEWTAPYVAAVNQFDTQPQSRVAAEPVGLREAVYRFLSDYDDSDRADAGNGPLMELHIAEFRQALATPSQPDPQSRGQAFDGEGEEFNRGYLLAVANLMNLHGAEVEARDVLMQLGCSREAMEAMDFCDCDLEPLRRIFDDIEARALSSAKRGEG